MPSWLPQRYVPPPILERCRFSDTLFTVYQRFNVTEHPLGSRHRCFRQAGRESDRARVPPGPRLATQLHPSRHSCPLRCDRQALLQPLKTTVEYPSASFPTFPNQRPVPALLSVQRYQHPDELRQLRFIKPLTIITPSCVGYPALSPQSRRRETLEFTSTELLWLSSSMARQKTLDGWAARVT